MITPTGSSPIPSRDSASLAIDTRGIEDLKQAARQNTPDSIKGAAKQFEALFMNMIMKSMRDATPQDGPFDNEQTKMYTSMLDQQISQNMATRGIGLADVLTRQLSGSMMNAALAPEQGAAQGTAMPGTIKAPASPVSSLPASRFGSDILQRAAAAQTAALQAKAAGISDTRVVAADSGVASNKPAHVKAFQDRLTAHAEEASAVTGIPAKFMLGQAALESGWGKHVVKAADGTSSNNLFGIKAGGGWKGKTVDAVTTEYVNGVPQKRVEKFRAYDSYADSFKDYAKLLRNNPRYENVLANATDLKGFAQGLQRAGYATDPQYANKITRLINQHLSV